VSPVRYELGFYIPEYDILHSDRREDVKSSMKCSFNPGVHEPQVEDRRYRAVFPPLRHCPNTVFLSPASSRRIPELLQARKQRAALVSRVVAAVSVPATRTRSPTPP
jgi:hypothetical protein